MPACTQIFAEQIQVFTSKREKISNYLENIENLKYGGGER